MRFVGQTEIAAFLLGSPNQGDGVRAWLAEIKHRRWASAEALAGDFGSVDVSAVPVVVFYLEPRALRIETLVDFRNGVVMLTAIERLAMSSDRSRQTWNMHRDH